MTHPTPSPMLDQSPASIAAANIRLIRKDRRWTTQQLADTANEGQTFATLTRQSLAKVEAGQWKLTVNELVALARALGVEPAALLVPQCERCHGAPPAGFTCNRCGADGAHGAEEPTR